MVSRGSGAARRIWPSRSVVLLFSSRTVGGYAAVTGDEVVEKGQFQYLWCNSSQASPGGDYDLDARFGGTGECLTVGRGEGEVVIAQQRSV